MGAGCYVAVPFLGGGGGRLQCVDVSTDLTFGNIEMYACHRTLFLDDVQLGDYVLNGVGDEGAVIRVPLAR